MIRLLMFFLLIGSHAMASERVVAGLSQNRVSITANFDGTGILVFGAVKRFTPLPDGGPLQVIVTVTGPSVPVTVRRKSRKLGIWINADSVNIDRAPTFYAVASTAPISEILSDADDLRNGISIKYMIHSVYLGANAPDAKPFSQAIVRIRKKNGFYSQTGGIVTLSEDTLFRAQFALPSNLVEGNYLARIFLTRDKKVIDSYQTKITVRKVGLERWLFNLAHERPLIYGLLSLTIAIFAGWLASAVFRYFRLS